MKVKFYKIQKERFGDSDVVVIYTKGGYSGMLEIKESDMSFKGKKDGELMDILFRPYRMSVPDSSGKGLKEKVLISGSPQHLEAIRRSCWSHGYISEMEES
jgi:hypothetical protein